MTTALPEKTKDGYTLTGEQQPFLARFIDANLPEELQPNSAAPPSFDGELEDWRTARDSARKLKSVELQARFAELLLLGYTCREIVGDDPPPPTRGDGTVARATVNAEYTQSDVVRAKQALAGLRRHGAENEIDIIMLSCLKDLAGLRYFGPKSRILASINVAEAIARTIEARAEREAVLEDARAKIFMLARLGGQGSLRNQAYEAGQTYSVSDEELGRLMRWVAQTEREHPPEEENDELVNARIRSRYGGVWPPFEVVPRVAPDGQTRREYYPEEGAGVTIETPRSSVMEEPI